MLYQGSCHCGDISFEVDAPEVLELDHCNCSICNKAGFLHLIIPKSKFRLLTGEDSITTYTFNSGIAKHTFCKVCGIKAFYTPRTNPDGIDVNANCLDTKPVSINITEFNGKNWEKHAHEVEHKSKDT